MIKPSRDSNIKDAAAPIQSENINAARLSSRKTKHAAKGRRKARSKDPTQGLALLHPNAAAIDISSTEHWVAIRPDGAEQAVRKFGCFTQQLEQLVNWLVDSGVDTVVMEATGNYWIVLYDLLEARGLRPYVVNARYAKNMQGRKTDLLDCQWMQRLHSYGLFNNSFRAPEQIRKLRAYLRQRESLVSEASQAIQHMQKALVEMNVQLANVISDISGETGLAIIDEILKGERDPEKLVRFKNHRIRATNGQIVESLRGHWKEEQLFALEQARLTYAHFVEQIAQCEAKVGEQMSQMETRAMVEGCPSGAQSANTQSGPSGENQRPNSFSLEAELKRIAGVDLSKIDGIGALTAQILISEVGVDMNAWPTEKHFASWLALCPDHRISGGKILGRCTRPVVSRARNALRMSAYSLERSKSALGAKYRRLKRRLGAPKAITAMANHLGKLVYRLLKYGQEYVDKGMAHYEARFREQELRWLQKKAAEMNMQLVSA